VRPSPWHARTVTVHRRDVLGLLGVGAAHTALWALGCGAPTAVPRRPPQVSGEVRTWLHDAVSRLASRYPFVHALAVSRRRLTAARDVIGAGIARLRSDGVVLTVRDHDGSWREYASSELTRDGVAAAAHALDAPRQTRDLDFGRPPATPDEPPRIDHGDLQDRLDQLLRTSPALAPRIVYAAAVIDVDDAITWSVTPGRDLEQRMVRIRNTAIRAAWSDTRPAVRHAERAWSGWLDDQPLTPDDLDAVSEAALEVTTPGGLADDERTVVLDPSVAAVVLDAAVRGLFTATAARRPEVARRFASSTGAPGTAPANARTANPEPPFASPLLTLIDDPTAANAYGGFTFDDEGELASPVTLIETGRLVDRLTDRAAGRPGRGRRPGHLGSLVAAPSHLRLVPSTTPARLLYSDGFLLEGGLGASASPGGDRIRVLCARARELKSGKPTGRIYADVEIVAALPALLAAIDAIADTPISFAPQSSSTHDPLWTSISTPALRTRALLRTARSRP